MSPSSSYNGALQHHQAQYGPFRYCSLAHEARPSGVIAIEAPATDLVYDPASAQTSLAGKLEAEARHLCCRNVTQVRVIRPLSGSSSIRKSEHLTQLLESLCQVTLYNL